MDVKPPPLPGMCRCLWILYSNWLAPWFSQPTELTARPTTAQASSPLRLTSTWQHLAYHSSVGWGARWLPKSPNQRHRPDVSFWDRWLELPPAAFCSASLQDCWVLGPPQKSVWSLQRRFQLSIKESETIQCFQRWVTLGLVSPFLIALEVWLVLFLSEGKNNIVKAVHQNVGQSQSHRFGKDLCSESRSKGNMAREQLPAEECWLPTARSPRYFEGILRVQLWVSVIGCWQFSRVDWLVEAHTSGNSSHQAPNNNCLIQNRNSSVKERVSLRGISSPLPGKTHCTVKAWSGCGQHYWCLHLRDEVPSRICGLDPPPFLPYWTATLFLYTCS